MEAVGLSALRAVLLAALVRVAGVAAAVGRNRREPLALPASRTSLTSVQARLSAAGPEIVLVPAHRVAGRIADAAIDALDGGVGGDARRARRRDPLDRRRARVLLGANTPFACCHFSKNARHVGRPGP